MKIGFDIDDVLTELTAYYLAHNGFSPTPPTEWGDPRFTDEAIWKELQTNKNFWLNLPVKEKLNVVPTCYITARSIPGSWTIEWLEENGFPRAPVYTVGRKGSKVISALHAGIDTFVDDSYENFMELNQVGIKTYLRDVPHNRQYEVGDRRIYNLQNFV